jgi:hypothetical protein
MCSFLFPHLPVARLPVMTDESEAKDRAVLDFATYEDYLDSQITERDLFYLEVCAP